MSRNKKKKVARPAAVVSPWRTAELWVPALAVAGAGLLAYGNSLSGCFVFDDHHRITQNEAVHHLWPLWDCMFSPAEATRPLVGLSLALNWLCGEKNVLGYHLVNLAVHILSALGLLGLVRRTLRTEGLRARFGALATPFALAVALLWVVHPLHTEAVTYIIQRAEAMMGLFYLLTLYCFIRGAAEDPLPAVSVERLGSAPVSERSGLRVIPNEARPAAEAPVPDRLSRPARRWYLAAAAACIAGACCKQVIITAPLLLFLYDRTFLAGSFQGAWRRVRRRWPLYAGLLSSWLVVAVLLAISKPVKSAGFEIGLTPGKYALSQLGVILQYLRLSFWPDPLCLDYGWPVDMSLKGILPGALVVGTLGLATLWALVWRPVWGFIGAWFFFILGPTSSFYPIKDLVFEHRMYLSLAAVIVACLAGVCLLIQRLGAGEARGRAPALYAGATLLVLSLALALTLRTRARNEEFKDEITVWKSNVAARPEYIRALFSLANAYAMVDMDAAIDCYYKALKLDPDCIEAHSNLGAMLNAKKDYEGAAEHLRRALKAKPEYVEAHFNLGVALSALHQYQESITHFAAAAANYGAAAALSPVQAGKMGEEFLAGVHHRMADAYMNWGLTFVNEKKYPEGLVKYEAALKLEPNFPELENNLGVVLLNLGQTREAAARFKRATELSPQMAQPCFNLGLALETLHDYAGARQQYAAALRLDPMHEDAMKGLARLPKE